MFLANTSSISVLSGAVVPSDCLAHEGGAGILRPQEADQNLRIADREGVEHAHRLVDLHIGEGFRRHVQVRPLHHSLHQHIALDLALAGGLVVHGVGDGEAGELAEFRNGPARCTDSLAVMFELKPETR